MSNNETSENSFQANTPLGLTSKKRKKLGRISNVNKQFHPQRHETGEHFKCTKKSMELINVTERRSVIKSVNEMKIS